MHNILCLINHLIFGFSILSLRSSAEKQFFWKTDEFQSAKVCTDRGSEVIDLILHANKSHCLAKCNLI